MISRRDALKLGAAGLVVPSPGQLVAEAASAQKETGIGDTVQDRGNAARTGETPGPGPDPQAPIAVKWQVTVGTIARATPAVINESVHMSAGDDQGAFVFSLDANTGQERWRHYTGKAVSPSSRALVDGVVYVGTAGNLDVANHGSTDPSEPNALALDAMSGEVIWSRPMPERINSSPAVADGVVFFGEHIALEAATGNELWSATWNYAQASPAIDEGVIYIVGGSLYALDLETFENIWGAPSLFLEWRLSLVRQCMTASCT